MKSRIVAAALAALASTLRPAGAQQIVLPPLAMPAAFDSGREWPLRLRHDQPAHSAVSPEAAIAESGAGARLPLWSATVADGISGQVFKYTMVGQNPQLPLSNPAVTVAAPIVPIVLQFQPQNKTFNPKKSDACSAAGSAIDLTLASPVFTTIADFRFTDGTDLGSGQYASLFQRGNFFAFVGPGGINPGLALTLTPRLLKPVTVPVAGGTIRGAPCGKLGEIDLDTFDAYLQSTVFPALAAALTPDKFPVFVIYNVGLFSGERSNCCTLGYHSAFANASHGGHVQTYAVAAYLSNGSLGSPDVAALSAAIDGWQDDPLLKNKTPAWTPAAPAQGCRSNLEVGDPLTGTTLPLEANGTVYHVQDLAFLSWFYHQTPSIGVEGLYSLWGTLTAPAAACG